MSRFTENPEQLGAKEIELDDFFMFECVGCSTCCRGSNNQISGTAVFLTEKDIKSIAKNLNISVLKTIEQFLEVYYEEELKLYVCNLKIKSTGVCVFLEKGKCSIYEARPKT